MIHQTITYTADGPVDMACPCGEDHGPSLREEAVIWEHQYRVTRARLAEETARADRAEWQLRLALRRLQRLRSS